MPDFQSPERLWALLVLPVLIVAYILVLRFSKKRSVRFTNTGVLGRVMGTQSRWVRHLAVAMSLASLAALTLAWAQPLGIDKVQRERASVIVVLDTSRSMAATDIKPSRLAAAKLAATDFVNHLPLTFNVAVVELSGASQIKIPPTSDRGAVLRAIDALELRDGTSIGNGIDAAMKAIRLAPPGEDEKPVPAMIVLLSDGTNTQGSDPGHAVAHAKSKKIPIFTIAYGTDNGFVDLDGRRERVAPDRALMREIAKITGGTYADAKSAGSLNDAYKSIGSSVGYEEVKKPVTARYAFGALGFAMVAALGAIMMAARWPS